MKRTRRVCRRLCMVMRTNTGRKEGYLFTPTWVEPFFMGPLLVGNGLGAFMYVQESANSMTSAMFVIQAFAPQRQTGQDIELRTYTPSAMMRMKKKKKKEVKHKPIQRQVGL